MPTTMPLVPVVLALFCFSVVSSDPSNGIVPCKKSDEACMSKSANIALPIIAAGNPSSGVEGFEPAHIKEISGEASNFIFNFTNQKIDGYSKCAISNVKLNLDEWNLKFDVTCFTLTLSGHLVVSGELLGVPVEGDDDYKLDLGKYLIKLDVDIGKVEGADGRQHLLFKTFKHIGIALEPFDFHYVNFKSKKELSPEAAAAFEKDKHTRAIELIAETGINTLYREVIFKSINKFFESIPFEDLFID